MSKLKILDGKGSPAGEFEVADDLLEMEKGANAVHSAVINFLAAIRAGTASTLTKAEVAGSNKKPWRQKGTGRARAGYRQSPVWRGGGVAFGPKPRDYSKKMNRKVAKLAFRRAISEKIAAGEIIVIDALELAETKTKAFTEVMANLKIERSALFVVDTLEANVKLSARNIKGVELVRAKDVDVYRLIKYSHVVITKAGMDVIMQRLSGTGEDDK
jgi:large subunit ribosomal protein L4